MTKLLRGIDDALARIEFAAVAVLAVAALALGVMQVVLRYVFNTGFTWSEAVFVVLTIAAMLFAGSRAVREDKHVRVDLVPALAPPAVRRVLQILADLAALLLTGYFAWCGLLYVQFVHMLDTVQPDTGLPDWVVYALVPVTMGAFAVRYLILIVRALRGEVRQTTHDVGAS